MRTIPEIETDFRVLSATRHLRAQRPRPSFRRSMDKDPADFGSIPGSLASPISVDVSEPGVAIYKFATPVVALTNGGGAIVGSARLVLLFWGSFWQTATNPSAAEIYAGVTDIVNSPYLSELSQYGFQSLTIDPPVIVIDPGPPFPRFTGDDPKDMVWDLIDDGKFPEPDDDNGRIVYMVFAPDGTQFDQEAQGAHGEALDFDLPADTDHAWVGWVDRLSFDTTMDVFSHELVETITDPEPPSGWTVNGQPATQNEIADICFDSRGVTAGRAVAAYYSKRLNACVVPGTPIVRSFGLHVHQQSAGVPQHVMDGLTTMEKQKECFHGTYRWSLWSQEERADVAAVGLSSFVKPDITWKVRGRQVFSFPLDFTIPADNVPDPLHAITQLPPRDGIVTARVSDDGNSLTLVIAPGQPAVDLDVSCIVSERAFPASYNLTRQLGLTISLNGSIRLMDARYDHDLNACVASRIQKAKLALIAANIPRGDHGDVIPPWVAQQLGPDNSKAIDEAHQALSLALDVERTATDLAVQLRSLAAGVLSQARAGRVGQKGHFP